MIVSRIQLTNWRNFRSVDVPLRDRTCLPGPNALGKSNVHDVFRFLRDICKSQGGGLQKALADRGGLTKLRSLHARRNPELALKLELVQQPDQSTPSWIYELVLKNEGGDEITEAAASDSSRKSRLKSKL